MRKSRMLVAAAIVLGTASVACAQSSPSPYAQVFNNEGDYLGPDPTMSFAQQVGVLDQASPSPYSRVFNNEGDYLGPEPGSNE